MDNDNANAANAATAAAEAATVLGGDASSAMEPMRAYLEKTVQTALNDAKRIYGSKDRASAEAELRSFVSKWARRYLSFEKYLAMPGLFEFMSFPSKAWPSLYTSNVIEGFNSVLKRKLRSRAAMNSLGNAYYLITNACERYNESRRAKRIAGFNELTAGELETLGMER